MDWNEALEKIKTEMANYSNLSRLEQVAFTFGFVDGFRMAQEDAQKKLDAYDAYVTGKLTLSELEEILN